MAVYKDGPTKLPPEPMDPKKSYEAALSAVQGSIAQEQKRDEWLANLRLLFFLLACGSGYLAHQNSFSHIPLYFSLAGFAFLVVLHRVIGKRLSKARRRQEFYQRGLERLGELFKETPELTQQFAPADHPYAADLDLFGPRSFYVRLCAARTPFGRHTLAHWLLKRTTPTEISKRIAAVKELKGNTLLREKHGIAGAQKEPKITEQSLVAWMGQNSPEWTKINIRSGKSAFVLLVTILFPSANFVLGILWFLGKPAGVAFVATISLQYLIQKYLLSKIPNPAIENQQLESLRELLNTLYELFKIFESQEFQDEKLKGLTAALVNSEDSSARAIKKLNRLIDLQDAANNQFFTPIAALLMWRVHTYRLLANWRRKYQTATDGWFAALGEMEALLSISRYAFETSGVSFAQLHLHQESTESEQRPTRIHGFIEGTNIAHPLLPRTERIPNHLRLDTSQNPGPQLLLISGSNMSGKSTYLRTVGLNAVLAQAGVPVCADEMRLTPLTVGASIRVQDSLQEGESRFYAELKRLKRVLDLTQGPTPVLFLFDEILHGTNSKDRLQGTKMLLEQILGTRAIGMITTHDLALTETEKQFPDQVNNAHFSDVFEQEKLVFDYKLHPGKIERSNAIQWMRSLGMVG